MASFGVVSANRTPHISIHYTYHFYSCLLISLGYSQLAQMNASRATEILKESIEEFNSLVGLYSNYAVHVFVVFMVWHYRSPSPVHLELSVSRMYDFIKIHRTLRMFPAIAAGVTGSALH